MKIVSVQTFPVRMPMRVIGAPPQLIGGPRTTMDMLLVRVETTSGVVGWGEAFGNRIWPSTRAAIDTLLAPAAIGRDAADIAGTFDALERLLNNAGRNGPGMFGLSGIDIALWDIAGKVAGRPVHQLLGDMPNRPIPAYASLLRYGNPAQVAEHVALSVSQGYRSFKLHEIEVAQVAAARAAAGPDIAMMIDTNCPWTIPDAIAMSRRFAPYDPLWIEEPIWPPEDFDGLARVRAEGGVALAAGENCGTAAEFDWMLRASAVDYAQPSIGKVAGLTGLRKIVEVCRRHGVPVVPQCTYFGPAFLATVHALVAWSDQPLLERFCVDLADSPYGDSLQIHDGHFTLPTTDGLGLDPDPAAIRRLLVTNP